MATINFKHSEFVVKSPPSLRGQPETEFIHRLTTRAHLKYLQDAKLLNVSDSQWSKATVDGEVCYAHKYENSILMVRLKTANGKFNLTQNETGAFDRHLLDNPGEDVVYAITSSNNGLESTKTFSVESAGIISIAIICAALTLTVQLAYGVAAAAAAASAETAVATILGVELSIAVPGVLIVLAVLAFIGIWIAYSVGRDIVLNLCYENRSTTQSINLVDHYVYNIGDSPLVSPVTLSPLTSVPPFEFYSDVAITIDNYSKIRGIGVSLKFEKEDGTSLVICIRNDIYHRAYYAIQHYPKGDQTTAKSVYDTCGGDLVSADVPWGKDLLVKNRLNPVEFNGYNFSGIISFNDAV